MGLKGNTSRTVLVHVVMVMTKPWSLLLILVLLTITCGCNLQDNLCAMAIRWHTEGDSDFLQHVLNHFLVISFSMSLSVYRYMRTDLRDRAVTSSAHMASRNQHEAHHVTCKQCTIDVLRSCSSKYTHTHTYARTHAHTHTHTHAHARTHAHIIEKRCLSQVSHHHDVE